MAYSVPEYSPPSVITVGANRQGTDGLNVGHDGPGPARLISPDEATLGNLSGLTAAVSQMPTTRAGPPSITAILLEFDYQHLLLLHF